MPPICYLNGRYVSLPEARVSPLDAGFLYGDGVYDTLRAFHGKVFLLERHLERLRNHLRELDIKDCDLDIIREAIWKLLSRNHLVEAVLRIQVSRGLQMEFPPHTRFGTPTVFILARRAPRYSAGFYRRGVSVVVSPSSRPVAYPKTKSTNFQANLLARRRAVDSGHFEAILSHESNLLEGSMSNVFLVKGNRLRTPPPDRHSTGRDTGSGDPDGREDGSPSG